MLLGDSLKRITAFCDASDILFISDEIYHGLTYDVPAETALKYSENAIVINSFSKYYSMTGWRVGWMVLPENLVRPVEKLAQNLYVSVPAISQIAALNAFDARDELEANKQVYARNRDILLERLPQIGLGEFMPMDGAFYAYVDVSKFTNDSLDFATRLLREAHVAATPGQDFDARGGHRYIRFSYAGPTQVINEALDRLADFMGKL
ncbi:MAG: aminotransferase class I/II-fold pyridoxal phosphate-dependent enzyme [Fimbriimonadaceae bacterium]|nr:aminotransferase class I/II-fold pyridoxal phosphate-dependent enzyme [Alphaproteobacteria bacterium]